MRIVLPLIFLGLLLAACADRATVTIVSPDESRTVSIDAELAVTPEEQQKGLMGRAYLPEDEGMLFVFEEEDVLSFWMKNTLIPLQILYFDGNGTFVNALDMVPCETDDCERYRSASVAKYALEVNPGFREEHGIGTGWRLAPETLAELR